MMLCMMAGRPFTTKKDALLCYFLHALQTLQQDKLKRPQMLTFFALSFPKLLFIIRFAFPSPKKSIVVMISSPVSLGPCD